MLEYKIIKEYGLIAFIVIILTSTFIYFIRILVNHTIQQSEKLLKILINHLTDINNTLRILIKIVKDLSEEHKSIIEKLNRK